MTENPVQNAKVRNMREEMAISGGRYTDEIRLTFDLPWARHNVTLHDFGDTQIPHLHLLFDGAYEVLAGSMEAFVDATWYPLGTNQYIVAPHGHVYNARVPPRVESAPALTYPGAGLNTGAVSMFTKDVPRGYDIDRSETGLLTKADWFPESFLTNPAKERDFMKAKKLTAEEFAGFVDVVERNRAKLRQNIPVRTFAAMDSVF